jgi:hypothetical protein
MAFLCLRLIAVIFSRYLLGKERNLSSQIQDKCTNTDYISGRVIGLHLECSTGRTWNGSLY